MATQASRSGLAGASDAVSLAYGHLIDGMKSTLSARAKPSKSAAGLGREGAWLNSWRVESWIGFLRNSWLLT